MALVLAQANIVKVILTWHVNSLDAVNNELIWVLFHMQ